MSSSVSSGCAIVIATCSAAGVSRRARVMDRASAHCCRLVAHCLAVTAAGLWVVFVCVVLACSIVKLWKTVAPLGGGLWA